MPKFLLKPFGPLNVVQWIVICVIILFIFIAVNRFWTDITEAFTSLFWQTDAEKLADQTERADTAEDNLASTQLEVEGAQASAGRVDHYYHLNATVQAATDSAVEAARSAPDATTPLDAGTAARLSANDDELCSLRPNLAGCAS